jgi:hypothetical protein
VVLEASRIGSCSMRKLTVLAVLGPALAFGACGGDPLDLESDKGEETTTVEAGKGRGTTPPETEKTRGTATGLETKPAKRRLIYLDARTLCREFGVRQIVRRFGIEPGSAADVARAYSEQNYSASFRKAGYRGCLAGFEK